MTPMIPARIVVTHGGEHLITSRCWICDQEKEMPAFGTGYDMCSFYCRDCEVQWIGVVSSD